MNNWKSRLKGLKTLRPTLGPQLALTRPNSQLEHMFKFPYLALTRLNLTWDQAQFSFRFVITFRRARRKENRTWYKPSTKRLPPTFLIDWHLPNQPTKPASVACFFSMQIFHTWEKCRLAVLKNSFYLLIFSTKNKTVSTITFNFLRD